MKQSDRHKNAETLNWTCVCKKVNPLWNFQCKSCGNEIPVQIKTQIYKEELAKQRKQIVLPAYDKYGLHESNHTKALEKFEKYLTPTLLGLGGVFTVLILFNDTASMIENIGRNFDVKIDRIVIGVQEIRDHFRLIRNFPHTIVNLIEKIGHMIKR